MACCDVGDLLVLCTEQGARDHCCSSVFDLRLLYSTQGKLFLFLLLLYICGKLFSYTLFIAPMFFCFYVHVHSYMERAIAMLIQI